MTLEEAIMDAVETERQKKGPIDSYRAANTGESTMERGDTAAAERETAEETRKERKERRNWKIHKNLTTKEKENRKFFNPSKGKKKKKI